MKQTINLNSEKLSKIIKESVNRILTEANNKRELAKQVAREILGTDSFEEFYKKYRLYGRCKRLLFNV